MTLYRGRFAPSPTGELHFGSLIAALASWLRARARGGTWLVRVDDIDPPREVIGSAAAILMQLAALGLDADAPVLYQSQRDAAYADALQFLRDSGHAFPCWCSRGDLEAARSVHHELHRDGHCFTPARDDRPPAWRLRVPDIDIMFDDALQGPQCQNVRTRVGDFVLRRADGLWGYHLACVVDDAFQGVTEIVRGADLLESTPRQILLQRLLGLPTPAYAHLPLAVDTEGHKLSKSSGAPPVDLHDPCVAINGALRFLGQPTVHESNVHALLRAAARQFDWASLRGVVARRVRRP
ncbi:MAG TPA: tRNA glutamyl-Q(34) synthetase GluQRS [Rhodanobacteraceae bacterium]